MYSFADYDKYNCTSRFNLLIVNAMFPLFYALKKLPTMSSAIIYSEWIWGPLTRNLTEIIRRGFFFENAMFQKNQSEVPIQVVSISRVLTVFIFMQKPRETLECCINPAVTIVDKTH